MCVEKVEIKEAFNSHSTVNFRDWILITLAEYAKIIFSTHCKMPLLPPQFVHLSVCHTRDPHENSLRYQSKIVPHDTLMYEDSSCQI